MEEAEEEKEGEGEGEGDTEGCDGLPRADDDGAALAGASDASTSPPRPQSKGGGGGGEGEGGDAERRRGAGPGDDTLHFLRHGADTVASLSLRYGVPAHVLRSYNRLSADHLLPGRRTLLIPGAWYRGGVSLSPAPVESEAEQMRKSTIRRWQVACKEADYDVAVLYLEGVGYDVAAAAEAYFADEAWERENPLDARGNGKGKAKVRARDRGIWNRASDAAFLGRAGPSSKR